MKSTATIALCIVFLTGANALYVPGPKENLGHNRTMIANGVIRPADFREDECGKAVEFELPAGSGLQANNLAIIGPPDYFCCDVS